MVTLSETLDSSGQTLIRAKEELTEKHITLLKMWGVSEIDVKYSKQEVDLDLLNAEHPPNLVKSAILDAETCFKHFEEDQKISFLLKKYYILNKLEELAK